MIIIIIFHIQLFYASFYFQSHPKMKDIISKSKGYPQKRLAHVYNLCKARKVCEGGDEMEKKKNDNMEEDEDHQEEGHKVCSFIFFVFHISFFFISNGS